MRFTFACLAVCLITGDTFGASPSAAISITSCNPTFTASKVGATYVVSAALAAAPGADCIDVAVPGVTINLNSMGLLGSPGVCDIKIAARFVFFFVRANPSV